MGARQRFNALEEELKEAEATKQAKGELVKRDNGVGHSKTRALILRLFQFMTQHYHGSSWNRMVSTINAHKSYVADFIEKAAQQSDQGVQGNVDVLSDKDFQELLRKMP